jgi:hypothetical protein
MRQEITQLRLRHILLEGARCSGANAWRTRRGAGAEKAAFAVPYLGGAAGRLLVG